MKKLRNLRLIGLVAILTFALVFIVLNFVQGQVKIQTKPETPPGQGKKGDDGAFQDMPLCIDFDGSPDDLTDPNIRQLFPNVDPLCASSRGITAFAGRRWAIVLEIHKKISDPYLVLSSSWDPLTPILGDPGYPDWGTGQTPTLDILGPDDRISVPKFMVGEHVQIKDMTADFLGTGAKLFFKDDNGYEYHLFWGPGPWPGDFVRTNKLSAPTVDVHRRDIDSPRSWDVYTQAESARGNAHTAFLWLRSGSGAWDYCGAFDVSFSYFAYEE